MTCGECADNRDRSGSAECKARGWGGGCSDAPVAHAHCCTNKLTRTKKETRRGCTRSAVSPPHAKAGGNHTVDKQTHTRTPGQVLVWQVVALQRNNNTPHIHKHNRHGITTTQKEGKEARKVAGEDRFEEGGGTGGRTAHTHGTRYAHAPEVQCRGRRKPFEPSGPNAVRTPPARSTVPKDARRAPAGVEKKGMRAVTLEADPHGVGIGHSAGANWSEVDRFWPSPRPAHVNCNGNTHTTPRTSSGDLPFPMQQSAGGPSPRTRYTPRTHKGRARTRATDRESRPNAQFKEGISGAMQSATCDCKGWSALPVGPLHLPCPP